MNIYIFQADVYCVTCIDKIKADIQKPNYSCDLSDERTFDSDDYPKGPFSDSETDYPEHCGCCGCFLETALTPDGNDYVKKAIQEAPKPLSGCVKTWANFYDYL